MHIQTGFVNCEGGFVNNAVIQIRQQIKGDSDTACSIILLLFGRNRSLWPVQSEQATIRMKKCVNVNLSAHNSVYKIRHLTHQAYLMRSGRNSIAYTLVAVLIYGGLLAPLHHSINMALGGLFPESAMAQHHSDAMACHDVPEVHVPAVPAHHSGTVFGAPHDGHPECPFMELFTISLLSYQPGASSNVSPALLSSAQLSSYSAFYWQDNTHTPLLTPRPTPGIIHITP